MPIVYHGLVHNGLVPVVSAQTFEGTLPESPPLGLLSIAPLSVSPGVCTASPPVLQGGIPLPGPLGSLPPLLLIHPPGCDTVEVRLTLFGGWPLLIS